MTKAARSLSATTPARRAVSIAALTAKLFEVSSAGTRHEQIGLCLAAGWGADDAGVEKTSARSFGQARNFMHGIWRNRIAVDDQRSGTAGTQSIRGLAYEIERGAGIHDRQHDVAFGMSRVTVPTSVNPASRASARVRSLRCSNAV